MLLSGHFLTHSELQNRIISRRNLHLDVSECQNGIELFGRYLKCWNCLLRIQYVHPTEAALVLRCLLHWRPARAPGIRELSIPQTRPFSTRWFKKRNWFAFVLNMLNSFIRKVHSFQFWIVTRRHCSLCSLCNMQYILTQEGTRGLERCWRMKNTVPFEDIETWNDMGRQTQTFDLAWPTVDARSDTDDSSLEVGLH